jgi:hypothetical protein
VTVLGYIVAALGVAFIFVGLAGAVRTSFGPKLPAGARGISADVLKPVTSFVEAMTKLAAGLKDAPLWLATTVLGLVLVFLGATLVGVGGLAGSG